MLTPDLTRAQWRKSSRSGNGAACVELAPTIGSIAVRDSKNPDGPKLAFARTGWATFTRSTKDGTFDRT